MRLHLSPHGSAVTPAHASDYVVRPGSFNLHAHYFDSSDFTQHDADEALAPGAAVLHLVNDNPRADGLTLDPTSTATAGQTVQLHVADAGGALFDSDQAAGMDRGFSAEQLDAGSQWRITDGVHSMNVTLQFVTIAGDMDGIFSDGFDGT